VLTADITARGWWLPSVIAGGIFLLLFGLWWLTLQPPTRKHGPAPRRIARKPEDREDDRVPWRMSLKPNDRDRGVNRAWLLSWAARLATGVALAMLAIPPVIAWLTHSTGSLGTVVHFIGFSRPPSWSFAALGGLIAAVTALARLCQAGLAKWNALGGPAGKNAAAKPGLLTQLAGSLRQKVLPWLASAVVVLGGAVLALAWISGAARAGFTRGQLVQVIAALVITVAARVAVNVNRLSMHDFYRWRLASAFAITREAAEEQKPLRARRLFADAAGTLLSGLPHEPGADGQPGLVICGTANINAAREVPPGRGGFCITFDAKNVILHREVGLKVARAEALTSDYEALVGARRFTLFDVSAISGAAISPLMGDATQHAYRLLFTATNVRLGVWLPHPNMIREARALLEPGAEVSHDKWWAKRPLPLLLWYLSPHPFWDRDAKQNTGREARLWAHVLRLRLSDKPGRRLAGALWYRVMQPTLGLLWAEAAGQLSYRNTWMYVTDGGHYENLGLVEALRRGASHIVVLDAAGDRANSWSTLGTAMALARADAGVEISLDPSSMVQGGQQLAPGEVVRPWAYGTFRRPEPVPGLPDRGEIWVCKLGWWTGAPWDVRAYAQSHRSYPCDSTIEQLYDNDEFEAYHQLGAAAVLAASQLWAPPLKPLPSPGLPADRLANVTVPSPRDPQPAVVASTADTSRA
jgi:hypothetical protein